MTKIGPKLDQNWTKNGTGQKLDQNGPGQKLDLNLSNLRPKWNQNWIKKRLKWTQLVPNLDYKGPRPELDQNETRIVQSQTQY